MKKVIKVLKIIVILVLVIVLALLIIPLTEKENKIKVEGSNLWMSKLLDELSLNDIIIPGTHDSATKNCELGFFSKCQSKGIKSQLEDGFRFLDIRLAVDDNQLICMHGFTKCRSSFLPWSHVINLDDVLDACISFLQSNPSETIVFSVKHEYGDESLKEFQKTFNSYIERTKDFWYLGQEVPCLKDVRGKIVLMRRFEDELDCGYGIHLSWSDQGNVDNTELNYGKETDHAGSTRLYVQDRYNYDSVDKWKAFISPIENREDNSLAINFLSTSGSFKFGHPFLYANKLNKQFMEKNDRIAAWTIVDFADSRLAQSIYKWNFEKDFFVDDSKPFSLSGALSLPAINFVGKEKNYVISWFKNNNLFDKLDIVYIQNDNVPKDIVISQSIEEGSVISDRMVIYVSKTNSFITVPNLVGKSFEEAKEALLDMGFTVDYSYVSNAKYEKDIVVFSDPLPGTTTEYGKMITLSLSRGAREKKISLSIDFTKLDIDLDKEIEIRVYIDGEEKSAFRKELIPEFTNILSLSFSGVNEKKNIKIKIDDKLSLNYEIDFSTGKIVCL